MKIDRTLLRASWQAWLGGGLVSVGPRWLQWLWTLLFCAAMAAAFAIMGYLVKTRDTGFAWYDLAAWAGWYGRNLVVSLTIGVIIHVAFDILGPMVGGPAAVRRWQAWQRALFFAGVPLICVVVGWPLGLWLAGSNMAIFRHRPGAADVWAGMILFALMLVVVFYVFFASAARRHDAERRATEAQLRLLQGQIEPHFLFNTLANVISLMDHDLPKARRVLLSFTEYLRTALGSLRRDEGPLAQELDLAENYLRLAQARMEDRLRYSIEADDLARAVPVPPLLLQPLVENAVVHGLEPAIDGGHVRLRAQLDGPWLVLEVHDDGLGFGAPPPRGGGHGIALDNVRSRLQSRYGSAASLELSTTGTGTHAVIRLPAEAAAP
ncbi:MAG TPA: histidine kinase [Rubrivivax sp.]|nr:histidine kinase [Rubrivivax sp.]